MAASGGYIVALGADRIFADANSLVGSIGVLFEFPNVSKLLDTVGVKVETIKSSPLKASPNGLRADQRGGARRDQFGGGRFLRLVQGTGQGTPPT